MMVVFTVGSLDANDGGPSRTVPALCDALAEFGVAGSIVACATGGAKPPSRVPTRFVSYGPIAGRSLRGIWAAPFRRGVVERARETRAEIIHDNGVWLQTNHGAAEAARAIGIPLIVSPRGMLEPWSLQQRSWKKRAAWWLFQKRDLLRAAAIHATSDMEADHLRALGIRVPIAVIPNGVDVPESLPARHDDPGRERTALFLSRVHPKKGLLTLVDAWARLAPAGWRCIIAGPDEDGHRADVERAVRAAGLSGVFEFVGPIDGSAKAALFHTADLFVLPTASENFGVVVAEALGYGVPVITTRGTPWAALETERCGWWIELGVDALETALRSAMQLSDVERRTMGVRGHAWVRREFAWPRIAREMRAVYDWVVRGGAVPPTVRVA